MIVFTFDTSFAEIKVRAKTKHNVEVKIIL